MGKPLVGHIVLGVSGPLCPGEGTALGSKSHPHRAVSLGCLWEDVPLFVLSWMQECAVCSGSYWVLRTDLVVSWLPCFKAINSMSTLFWKN